MRSTHPAGAAVVLALLAAAPAAALPAPGWTRLDLPGSGTYALRYVPKTLSANPFVPVIVFLHGAGGSPEPYQPFVQVAAEATGAVLVLPKSLTDVGWGAPGDREVVAASLSRAGQDLPRDPLRTGIAGHSAGGAYAYLLAYSTRNVYSAVFTLAASAYPVTSVADPLYRAPIRMYYGSEDPNYTDGPYAALVAQWQRLGIPWEDDIRDGYGHNTWPPVSMADGFRFLVTHPRTIADHPAPNCVADATAHCFQSGRFRAEVTWDDGRGGTGVGHVVPGASDDSGLFWFFSQDNWELLVKVLDGCAINGHYWVFAAATTDVGYTLTVTDTVTGVAVPYDNPPGRPSPATTDTQAFETCP